MTSVGERRWSGLIKTLGPGVLYAGAAVGVSHLVQSTRAGAMYGFALVWAVLAANLFKYPFFEFGHRYGAATGESLLHGYLRVSRRILLLYLVLSLCLSIPATAVVTIVTAGLAIQLLGLEWSPATCSTIILLLCASLLLAGRYPWLDKSMKLMMALLALSTVVALAAAAWHGSMASPDFVSPRIWTVTGVSFIIALMGWMPTPLDASAWSSLWALERRKQTGHQPTLGEALLDFNLGYIGASILALMFLALGALVMYGTSARFADDPAGFAAQFVRLYTTHLGSWSSAIILITAFATMLGTVLTVVDCYPRVLRASCELIWPGMSRKGEGLYRLFMGLILVCTLLILQSTRSLLRLVDVVTIVAFLSAPVLALINYRVLTSDHIPPSAAPPTWLRVLAWMGVMFLTGFSILYLMVRFDVLGH